MNEDLKRIKKKFGEEMAHFCREHFASLLDEKTLLPRLLETHFECSRFLYQDILKSNLEQAFISYIFSLMKDSKPTFVETSKTPFQLLDEAGYILYECHKEEDIQRFKKYYATGEELCTFRGGRLTQCRVFFAVKKDVNQIRREDYLHPKRQDLYGTSVISIQFTRTTPSVLSIKNRYNHKVVNPDATFSNCLDQIIPGLHYAFSTYYSIDLSMSSSSFEIPNYHFYRGKYYKYNLELFGIYYGVNNNIVSYNKVFDYPKEQFIIFDCYVLDLVNKEIRLFDERIVDTFGSYFSSISRIEIHSFLEYKSIYLFSHKEMEAVITLNSRHQMVALRLNSVIEIGDNFGACASFLKSFEAPKLKVIGNDFLCNVTHLKTFHCENLEIVGDRFLFSNQSLEILKLNSLKKVGDQFLGSNFRLKKFECSLLEEVGNSFLYYENSMSFFFANSLKKVGDDFFCHNQSLVYLECRQLEEVGLYFMPYNRCLKVVHLEKLKRYNYKFLDQNFQREVNRLKFRIFVSSFSFITKESFSLLLKK